MCFLGQIESIILQKIYLLRMARRKNDTSLRKLLVREVINIYHKVLAEKNRPDTIPEICKIVSERPASRFYLNKRYAMEYASARARGEHPDVKRSYHRAALEAFYDILVIELMRPSRYDDMKSVIAKALAHPAPSLGLSPIAIQRIIQKYRRNKISDNE